MQRRKITGPKGCQLEVVAQRAEGPLNFQFYSFKNKFNAIEASLPQQRWWHKYWQSVSFPGSLHRRHDVYIFIRKNSMQKKHHCHSNDGGTNTGSLRVSLVLSIVVMMCFHLLPIAAFILAHTIERNLNMIITMQQMYIKVKMTTLFFKSPSSSALLASILSRSHFLLMNPASFFSAFALSLSTLKEQISSKGHCLP